MGKQKRQEKAKAKRDARVKEQLARKRKNLREERSHEREIGRIRYKLRERIEPIVNPKDD